MAGLTEDGEPGRWTAPGKADHPLRILPASPCYSTYHMELGEISSYPRIQGKRWFFATTTPTSIAECPGGNPRKLCYLPAHCSAFVEEIMKPH